MHDHDMLQADYIIRSALPKRIRNENAVTRRSLGPALQPYCVVLRSLANLSFGWFSMSTAIITSDFIAYATVWICSGT